MVITPNGNRVLVERIDIDTLAGIHIPAASDVGVLRVVAVGDGRRLDTGAVVPVPFKIGDEIVCRNHGVVLLAPPELYGGKHLAFVDVDAIQGKVERESAADGIQTGPRIVRATGKPKEIVHA